MKFTMTNGDRSIELTGSFLLVSRYLDFEGLVPAVFDGSVDCPESLLIHHLRLISLSLSPSTAGPVVSPWIIVGGVAGGIVVIGILICICGIAGMWICSIMYRGSVMWKTL